MHRKIDSYAARGLVLTELKQPPSYRPGTLYRAQSSALYFLLDANMKLQHILYVLVKLKFRSR